MPSLPSVVPGDLFAFPYFAGKIPGPVARLMAQSLRSDLSPSRLCRQPPRASDVGDEDADDTEDVYDIVMIKFKIREFLLIFGNAGHSLTVVYKFSKKHSV